MLNKCKLLTLEKLDDVLYEDEAGILGTDGYVFNKQLLINNKFMNRSVLLNSISLDEDGVLVCTLENKIGDRTLVPLQWINTVDGYRVKKDIVTTNTAIYITRELVLKDGKLIAATDLPKCHCSAFATVTLLSGEHICAVCNNKLLIRANYSYKPTYEYIGEQLRGDIDTPLHFGIEIEVGIDDTSGMSTLVHKHNSSIYLKKDSSIRGGEYQAEIVSHPHTFKELMGTDSFINSMKYLPQDEQHVHNGMHIHISRTAFTDDKHYSLFYFLLHKMNDICTKVGGRELTYYCKLTPIGSVSKKSNKLIGDSDRSVYLNERNIDTVEARFFRSTTNITDIKANIQLLESVIKYTKYHSKAVSDNGWFAYISKKPLKYKELLTKVSEDYVKNDKVVFRVPKLTRRTVDTLRITDRIQTVHTTKKPEGVNIVGEDNLSVSKHSLTIGCDRFKLASINYMMVYTKGEQDV